MAQLAVFGGVRLKFSDLAQVKDLALFHLVELFLSSPPSQHVSTGAILVDPMPHSIIQCITGTCLDFLEVLDLLLRIFVSNQLRVFRLH